MRYHKPRPIQQAEAVCKRAQAGRAQRTANKQGKPQGEGHIVVVSEPLIVDSPRSCSASRRVSGIALNPEVAVMLWMRGLFLSSLFLKRLAAS